MRRVSPRPFLLAALTLLALLGTSHAQGNDTFYAVTIGESHPDEWGRFILQAYVPPKFPEQGRILNAQFICDEGLDHIALGGGVPDSWLAWAEGHGLSVKERQVTIGAYTFGCSEDWYYLQGESLEDLIGILHPLGPNPSLAITGIDPFKHFWTVPADSPNVPGPSLGYRTADIGRTVVPLTSPLEPRFFMGAEDLNGPFMELDMRSVVAAPGVAVIAARQDGALTPILFNGTVTPLEYDTSQPIELHLSFTSSGGDAHWDHFVLDPINAAILYRADTTAPNDDDPTPPSITDLIR